MTIEGNMAAMVRPRTHQNVRPKAAARPAGSPSARVNWCCKMAMNAAVATEQQTSDGGPEDRPEYHRQRHRGNRPGQRRLAGLQHDDHLAYHEQAACGALDGA